MGIDGFGQRRAVAHYDNVVALSVGRDAAATGGEGDFDDAFRRLREFGKERVRIRGHRFRNRGFVDNPPRRLAAIQWRREGVMSRM